MHAAVLCAVAVASQPPSGLASLSCLTLVDAAVPSWAAYSPLPSVSVFDKICMKFRVAEMVVFSKAVLALC